VTKKKESDAYKNAGVDIDAGNNFVTAIKPLARSTRRNGALNNLGGFGALFDLKAAGYDDPILVAATDGVGTKLKVAIETRTLSSVGIDLVAMCVNDLICQGAEPLFFLDYLATAKLNVSEATDIIDGITKGCKLANIALIGGETAEMPGMYDKGDFDLAGFAVGALNRGENLPKNIKKGDILIGISSSGIHSNGFSLVRKIIKDLDLSLESTAPFAKGKLGIELLEPTRIYVKSVLDLHKNNLIKGLAHITGGGLTENVPRILDKTLGAEINLNSIVLPEVFQWLFSQTKLEQHEALKTFNCGIGMVLVVSEENVSQSLSILQKYKEKAMVIGEIIEGVGVKYSGVLPVN
jgi:phosphoribosylformylglycinamidine cyclo-ligase